MFNKILIAADGSDHSVRAAQYAIELADRFSSSIEIVYVVDGDKSKTDVLHFGDKHALERMRIDKLSKVEKLIDDSKIDYEFHILHGEPGPMIVKFANENDIDCVVIGSRGLNKLQTFLLGSVSHKVAKRVDCPVLIVK